MGHIGIVNNKIRAKSAVYWPNMNTQLEDMVNNCSTCLDHRNQQQAEPLLNHEIPNGPWQKEGSDLFKLFNEDYLLVVDYFSGYVEIAHLKEQKAQCVINNMKKIFSHHGIPLTVMADNGPQYVGHKFIAFANEWNFDIVTSSPHYPKSNGLAERNVQTIKNMLRKVYENNEDPYLAILMWNSTPKENGKSPSDLIYNVI